MEHSVGQTQKRNRQAQRRALWFMIFLLILVVGATVGASFIVLKSAKVNMEADTSYSLVEKVRHRVSELNVQYGTVREQIRRLAQTDLFRLFASEITESNVDVAMLRSEAQQINDEEIPSAEEPELARLALQMTLIEKHLHELLSKSPFLSIRFLTPDMKEYLVVSQDNTTTALRPEQASLAQAALKANKLQVHPAQYDQEGRLVMEMATLLYTPTYISEGKIAGIMLLSLNTKQFTELFPQDKLSNEFLLQVVNGELYDLLPGKEKPAAPVKFNGWSLSSEGELPFSKRTLPEGTSVYSVGLPVPGLPWLIVQDIDERILQEAFSSFSKQVFWIAGSLGLAAILLFIAVWWWLMGRREKAVAVELLLLYNALDQQKKFLDSINGALADGILLEDVSGKIQYANKAFADLLGRTPESVLGLLSGDIFNAETAGRLRFHHHEVVSKGIPANINEILLTQGQVRHFQIASSPMRSSGNTLVGVVSVFRDTTELVEAQEQAQNMLFQTISVLVRAVEAVDPYLRGQSMRTGELALSLASMMDLDVTHKDTLRIAANLSQLGMIQLPRQLLSKTGALTPEEYEQVKQHVVLLEESLDGIEFGLPVIEAIRQMFERLDGSGYPYGLQGDQIDVDGRILAIANSFCAIVRPRAYRDARTIEEAMQILSAPPYLYDQDIVGLLREFLQTYHGQEFMASLTKE